MTKSEIIRLIYDLCMLKILIQSFFLKAKYIHSLEKRLEEQ